MIQALGNAALTEIGEAAGPVQITGIWFQDRDLCRPRYPTLIDETYASGARFEPGFQILSAGSTLKFRIQLDPKGEAEFDEVIRSVNGPGLPLGLTAEWSDRFTTCQLTLDGPLDKLTALRLSCRWRDRRRLSKEEIVYGGIYLVIVNREEPVSTLSSPIIAERKKPEQGTVKLLGLDCFGRPVYDLFVPTALPGLPRGLGLEPTLRVHGNEEVDLMLLIDTPKELNLRFKKASLDHEQVEVAPFEPDLRPPQLKDVKRMDDGRRCHMVWKAGLSGKQAGGASTFYLEADMSPDSGESACFLRHHGVRKVQVQIDPTVIQPPSCTGGICV